MINIVPATNVNLKPISTKCGEIHYEKSNFCFSCIFCEANWYSLEEFGKHFEKLHLNEYFKELVVPSNKETAKSVPDNDFNHTLDDPLYCLEEPYLKTKAPQPCADQESAKEIKVSSKGNITKQLNDLEQNTTNIFEVKNDYLPKNDSDIGKETPMSKNTQRKRSHKVRLTKNMCNYCGRTFRRRYQLETHVNIHTGAKPHQCEICGRQFRAVTTLQRHLVTHDRQYVFSCKFCTQSFTHKAALLSHESRHTQERRVPCDECDKLFYTENQFDTHKRRVHNKINEVLPFACDLCSKRYRSASMLSTHKFRKHYKTARFACEKCDKKFIDQHKLEEHQTIHKEGMPIS